MTRRQKKPAPVQTMTWRARVSDVRDIPDDRTVHDGDTLFLTTDQGDWDRKVRACRLHNAFAPEQDQKGFEDCKQLVVNWVKMYGGYDPKIKWPFLVDTVQDSRSNDVVTFGRFVTDVYNADRTSHLNAVVAEYIATNGYPRGTGG